METSVASEKTHKLDEHIGVAVAGINSDANILINSARLSAQRYAMSYAEPVPLEQLVQNLCDQKQGYTQYGGLRPFGVSFLFAGWCVCSARLYLLPISDDRLRPSNSLTGTRVLGFSCTKVILRETTLAGLPRPSSQQPSGASDFEDRVHERYDYCGRQEIGHEGLEADYGQHSVAAREG